MGLTHGVASLIIKAMPFNCFLTFVILKAMSFNCFSYSQVKILLFGRVKMVKASKKGEAISTCYDKSKNDIMIHDP